VDKSRVTAGKHDRTDGISIPIITMTNELDFLSVTTSSFLTFTRITVQNFALKFQLVVQKVANNFRGYFLPHPVYEVKMQ